MLTCTVQKELHGTQGKFILDVTLEVPKGEFTALWGESGSGKTTLLRILAGLEKAKAKVMFDNTLWQDSTTSLPPQQRSIGYVFQDYALFENMNVLENLLFVKKDKSFAQELLEMAELTALQHKLPRQLSGGQKQRVALCRALIAKPKLLLLDEPFSALDHSLKEKLQYFLQQLHKELSLTTIMVSHEPSDIFRLASKIVRIENGKIVQEGTKTEIAHQQSTQLTGEVLDIFDENSQFFALLAIKHSVITVTLTQEQFHTLHVGDTLSLNLTP